METLEFECPNCGTLIEVEPDEDGFSEDVECAHCGSHFRLDLETKKLSL